MAFSANLGGWIADTLVSKGTSVTTVRKVSFLVWGSLFEACLIAYMIINICKFLSVSVKYLLTFSWKYQTMNGSWCQSHFLPLYVFFLYATHQAFFPPLAVLSDELKFNLKVYCCPSRFTWLWVHGILFIKICISFLTLTWVSTCRSCRQLDFLGQLSS